MTLTASAAVQDSAIPVAPLWTPPPARIAASNLTRFAAPHGFAPGQDEALWRWSVERREEFWSAVWNFCGVQAAVPPTRALTGDRMPGARWFEGARLNFAENLLAGASRAPVGAAALVALDESGRRRELSWPQLTGAVERLCAALAADGVQAGDRVAGLLPNGPEAVIAMLATARLGAVWSSCSPDYGEAGVLDRFGQIEPKVLFACDSYLYNGKLHDTRARVIAVRSTLAQLRRLVWVAGAAKPLTTGDGIRFEDYAAHGAPDSAALPFDHPLYILYSSGTTGKPKCVIHGAGGTLLQHLKEHILHTDVKPGDRVFFYATCGWMMWNWLVSALAAGATVVLYDGSPLAPTTDALWHMAQSEGLSHFGTSPKYLSTVEKSGFVPGDHFSFPRLRSVLSTGSPLAPKQFDFVYQGIKSDVQLASISGGTDIISCFALGHPWKRVYRGELQGPGLGMALDVLDEAGQPLNDAPGELVCSSAFPSMPLGFWNDPDEKKYTEAYFERFPGVWHQGDYAQWTQHGGLVITGRSDSTLNPGGVRIGTAEIYRVVEALPEVLESVVVAHRHGGDERVILFVRLRDSMVWDKTLESDIRNAIRRELTARHVPARIFPCPEVPRTLSGKVTEIAVRELIHGRDVRNPEVLANPGSLEYFKNLASIALNGVPN